MYDVETLTCRCLPVLHVLKIFEFVEIFAVYYALPIPYSLTRYFLE